jgi:hypothetical protein
VFSQVSFDSFGKLTSRQQDAPPAAFAFESNVRAKADDGPLVGAAWMLFSQAKMIVETQVGKHWCSVVGWQ